MQAHLPDLNNYWLPFLPCLSQEINCKLKRCDTDWCYHPFVDHSINSFYQNCCFSRFFFYFCQPKGLAEYYPVTKTCILPKTGQRFPETTGSQLPSLLP